MHTIVTGQNCIIAESATIGEKVQIGHNCIIEDGVTIGNNAYIDSNTTIRRGVTIGDDAFIGSNCIIGEYWMDFCKDLQYHEHPLTIGNKALIRSGSIIYAGSTIGDCFQTGHQVTIREKAQISDEKVIESHIRMFVNDFSRDVGVDGRCALECLWTASEC